MATKVKNSLCIYDDSLCIYDGWCFLAPFFKTQAYFVNIRGMMLRTPTCLLALPFEHGAQIHVVDPLDQCSCPLYANGMCKIEIFSCVCNGTWWNLHFIGAHVYHPFVDLGACVVENCALMLFEWLPFCRWITWSIFSRRNGCHSWKSGSEGRVFKKLLQEDRERVKLYLTPILEVKKSANSGSEIDQCFHINRQLAQ